MHPLVARARRTVRRFSLITPGTRVLVALSGGADSIALLHVLRELELEGDCRVVAIAHLNHLLRGDAANEDEDFCRAVAADLGLPFECERVDVGRVAAERGLSIEAAGHAARYDFFERAAARVNADRVAIGHTRDDQAETFLLRVLRGAGPRGLAGIHPRSGIYVRPLLDCSRAQVRRFVEARALPFREDATNLELSVPRNRVRHDVIPYLARVSPGIVRALGREAAIARDDADFLDARAREAFARIARESEDEMRLDTLLLAAEGPAIARRVAAMAACRLTGRRFLGFEHVEALLDLVHDDSARGGAVHLPGAAAIRLGTEVVLSRKSGRGRVFPASGTNSFRFSLSIPGEVVSPLGWTVSAERAPWPGDGSLTESAAARTAAPRCPPSHAVLDLGTLAAPLLVRNWAPGDRMRPLGMTGTRKLQDLFVDRKVPRARRAEIPVVVDGRNRVVWVAGHAIGEDFRVTGGTSDVLILKLKYWRNGT